MAGRKKRQLKNLEEIAFDGKGNFFKIGVLRIAINAEQIGNPVVILPEFNSKYDIGASPLEFNFLIRRNAPTRANAYLRGNEGDVIYDKGTYKCLLPIPIVYYKID